MKKLMIIGASGHGKVIEEVARLNGYQIIEYLDDRIEELKSLGMNVVGKCSDIPLYIDDYQFAIGIGNNSIRKKYLDIIKEMNGKLPVLVHPSAVVSPNSELKSGTCIMANAVINIGSEIGEACIINTAATVDHECQIEECVHISPGVHLAGNVIVGELAWIGIGSCVIQGITIGKNSIIGAGTVVIRDVSNNVKVVGIPSKVISKCEE